MYVILGLCLTDMSQKIIKWISTDGTENSGIV